MMNEDPNRSDDEQFKALVVAAGLPNVKITTEDRLRGAIVTALMEMEAGRPDLTHSTLKEAVKL